VICSTFLKQKDPNPEPKPDPYKKLMHDSEVPINLGIPGTRTKVPLRFVTYFSKVMKINEKSVFTQ
jgi:hypothetical protein